MSKTNEQFLNSLAGEDLACFFSIRDGLAASTAGSAKELGALLVEERSAEITALKTEHASAIADVFADSKRTAQDADAALAAMDAEITALQATLISTVDALKADHAAALEKSNGQHANALAELHDALAEADARTAATLAEFTAYKEAAGRAATAIKAVITDPTKDDAVTVATITYIVSLGETEANKTARERELDAAKAKLAAAQAAVAALEK